MNDKKSARPAGDAAERATVKNDRPVTFPRSDFNTTSARSQGFIECLLARGAENATSMETLQTLTGLSRQGVVNQIERERMHGAPILSSCRRPGYYLPDSGEKGQMEAAACIATIMARGAHTLRTARAIERAMGDVPGQLFLGGDSNGST